MFPTLKLVYHVWTAVCHKASLPSLLTCLMLMFRRSRMLLYFSSIAVECPSTYRKWRKVTQPVGTNFRAGFSRHLRKCKRQAMHLRKYHGGVFPKATTVACLLPPRFGVGRVKNILPGSVLLLFVLYGARCGYCSLALPQWNSPM